MAVQTYHMTPLQTPGRLKEEREDPRVLVLRGATPLSRLRIQLRMPLLLDSSTINLENPTLATLVGKTIPSCGLTLTILGASSNHAFFWSVTASLDDLATHVSSRYKLHSDWAAKQDGPSRLPLPPLKSALATPNLPATDDTFPGRAIALKWVDIFLSTVAAATPYVTKAPLARAIDMIDSQTGTWQSTSAPTQALLNIVFAHALSTSEDGAAEPYYRRALSSLDEKLLYLPSVESRKRSWPLATQSLTRTVQALLLLASFQQNSQRAMESITTLFRAVQAAYQLGIHSPSSYERLRDADKELRSQLWFAVVNHDRYACWCPTVSLYANESRMIGSGLGRPFLIPMEHVCMELADYMDHTTRDLGATSRLSKSNAQCFRHRVYGCPSSSCSVA